MALPYYLSLTDEYSSQQRRLSWLLHSSGRLPAAALSAALRAVLRPVLPGRAAVGAGYLHSPGGASEAVDLLIYDPSLPLWYQEGDFVVVRPEAVLGMIQIVPELLAESQLQYPLEQLSAASAEVSRRRPGSKPCFAAVFAAHAQDMDPSALLRMLQLQRLSQPEGVVTHVAAGAELFMAWQQPDADTEHPVGDWELTRFEPGPGSRALAHLLQALHDSFLMPVQPVQQPAAPRMPETPAAPQPVQVAQAPVEPVRLPEPVLPQPEPPVMRQIPEPEAEALPEPVPVAVLTAEEPVRLPEKKAPRTSERRAANHQDAAGNTPLHLAVLAGDEVQTANLLEEDANPNLKNKEGDTPLHLAARMNRIQIAELLLIGEADVNARNYVYAAPLHVAAEHNHAAMVQLLLGYRAEIEARNNRGKTPLHVAAIAGSLEAAEALIAQDADLEATMEKDMQPLHLAAWYGHSGMVDLLIGRGADRNAANADGNTALHFAAFNGQVKIIKLLINHQADMGVRNAAGITYLQGLNEGYSGEMIKVLD
ncbi:MAG: ankyrin repeat domain-containing protein [Bacteroidia bacterium]|nr:ankyrin repeat domain-containing protein [Bacteroidia bacterium]